LRREEGSLACFHAVASGWSATSHCLLEIPKLIRSFMGEMWAKLALALINLTREIIYSIVQILLEELATLILANTISRI
jgi:hypothetical protein